ncbi:MAG TPA: nucleotide sugar dehydrogenase [Bacteroidetes bacterium]|nr:nucleotide sugar dehydrogenase [Bacteroidota bacterium]
MTNPSISELFVNEDSTIEFVMNKMNSAVNFNLPSGIVLVVDEFSKLLGVLTDGDIRRSLIAGIPLYSEIRNIYIKDPIVFSSELSYKEILHKIPQKLLEKNRYKGNILEKIVIVNNDGYVINVFDFMQLWSQYSAKHRNISVIGLGYVGLTLAVTLADVGFKVYGIEKNNSISESLKNGKPHFFEVGLEPMLKLHVNNNLEIVNSCPEISDVFIVAVGTPLGNDFKPKLDDLQKAIEEIAQVLTFGNLIILRSTCPLGTCRNFVVPKLEELSGLKCGKDFFVSFAPERTVEGKALQELKIIPQIIGGYDKNSQDLTTNIFSEFCPSIIPVENLEIAEMAKLINNSFRDLKFAFVNELSLICEQYNLDSNQVVKAANQGYLRDPLPVPSPGVGGACLIKDPYIYSLSAKESITEFSNLSLSILGRKINESIPRNLFNKLNLEINRLNKKINDVKIFLVGFAFKGEPETSDIRNSTTIDFLDILKKYNYNIYGYDPVADKSDIENLGVKFVEYVEGFKNADCVCIMNNHRSYSNLDIFNLLELTNKPSIYADYWNIFPSFEIKKIEGIRYLGLSFSA